MITREMGYAIAGKILDFGIHAGFWIMLLLVCYKVSQALVHAVLARARRKDNRLEYRYPTWPSEWLEKHADRLFKKCRPDIERAHQAVARAIQRGELTRPDTCSECGREARIIAHHEDYSKPLDVQWLCPQCHQKRGKEVSHWKTLLKAGLR